MEKKWFINYFTISIGPWNDQKYIADIMNHKKKDSNHPKVHHIREKYEEH